MSPNLQLDAPSPPRDGSLSVRRPWWGDAAAARLLAVIFGFWVAVAAIYWPSAVALNAIWTGSAGNTYTHGYLVLAACLWLIVRDRARLAATPVRPSRWAWLLVIVLSAAWVWSWRAAIQELHVLLLPAILLAALAGALGWRIARVLLVPVGLLLFAMPAWSAINGILETLSARENGMLIWLSGLPAYMQGNMIRLPAGSIEIADTCTGLNGLVIGLALAVLYGELERDPLGRRLAWLALMGTLTLAANAVRIFIVTVAAYESDMHSSLVTHHIWVGWCLFVVATVAFRLITGRLEERRSARGTPQPGRPAQTPLPRSAQRPGVAPLAITLAGLGLLPLLAYGSDLLRSASQAQVAIQWPAAPTGWQGPLQDQVSEWSPQFVNSSAESLRRYVDSHTQPVEVFAVAYRSQTQDGKLLQYRNDLLGSGGRLRLQAQQVVGSSTGGWRETLAVDPAGNASLIWWRYRIGERAFVKPYLSQLWYGLAAIAGSPLSSLTALRTPCTPDCGAARERLANAAARLQPALTSMR